MSDNTPFGWLPMDPATAAALAGNLPHPFSAAAAHGVVYYLNLPQPLATVSTATAAAAVARQQRQNEEEDAAGVRMVHLLLTSAGAIQAGDHSSAQDSLTQARSILAGLPTSTGIGRIARHFVDALAQRISPASAAALPPPPPPVLADLHNHFYNAGPYLKFAFSTANKAILDAFRGCDRVHIVDLGIMQGHQWPSLIHALSRRHGGPPHLRITGVGATASGDVLAEVGRRLRQFASSLDVPFTFREVRVDALDGIPGWMLGVVPGEALAINSVLQLHRLLAEDADDTAAIDAVLRLVTSLQPRVFTVVEQEADHNRPALLERFTNALFHYASMFDSMEAVMMSHRLRGGLAGGVGVVTRALAEALLRAEILDVVCGEGSARVERHEPMVRWRERLARAGLAQVPFGPDEARHAVAQLALATRMMVAGGRSAGYGIVECDGALALAWHGRALYAATAWRVATRWWAAAGNAVRDEGGSSRNGSSGESSNGRGDWASFV
nr:unnamed protein product [Digitaria exilis]